MISTSRRRNKVNFFIRSGKLLGCLARDFVLCTLSRLGEKLESVGCGGGSQKSPIDESIRRIQRSVPRGKWICKYSYSVLLDFL
ncbi:hypothetical protein QLX08_006181 [Tetragonisca angustula]|uniref:Uncharacterized protein n=1 Tax=Tetragonisca angustula TaxID=166442 RepID=A0AAW0ZUZ5_9HYME